MPVIECIEGGQDIQNKACKHLNADVPRSKPGTFFIIVQRRAVTAHQRRKQPRPATSQSPVSEHQKQETKQLRIVTIHGAEEAQKSQNKNQIHGSKRLCQTEGFSHKADKYGDAESREEVPERKR